MSEPGNPPVEPSYAVDGAAGTLPPSAQIGQIVDPTAKALINNLMAACKRLSDTYNLYKNEPNADNIREYTSAYNRYEATLQGMWGWADRATQQGDMDADDSRRLRGNVLQIKTVVANRGLFSPDDVEKLFKPGTTLPTSQPSVGTSGGAGAAGGAGTSTNNMYLTSATINTKNLAAECGMFKGTKGVLVPAEFMQKFEDGLLRQTYQGQQVSDASKINLFRLLLTDTAATWHDQSSRRATAKKPTAVEMFSSWGGSGGYKACFLKEYQTKITPYEISRLKERLAKEAKGYSTRQEALYFLCEQYSYEIHVDVDKNAAGLKIREDTAIELFLVHCERLVKEKLANVVFGTTEATVAIVMETIQKYDAYCAMDREGTRRFTSAIEGDEYDSTEEDVEKTSAVQKQASKREKTVTSPKNSTNKTKGDPKKTCYYCKKPNHFKFECRLFAKKDHSGFQEYKKNHDKLLAQRAKKAISAIAEMEEGDGSDEGDHEEIATVSVEQFAELQRLMQQHHP